MKRSRTEPGVAETLVSLSVMLVLAAVAAGVWQAQHRFQPAAEVMGAFPGSGVTAAAPGQTLIAPLPPALTAMGPLETFGPAALADKINGKAEFYLAAGFERLRCQRFNARMEPVWWAELCIYRMRDAEAAFAVYSGQRRSDAETMDLTRYAYRTRNALFWVHGSDYAEAIASTPSRAAREGLQSLAEAWVRQNPLAGTGPVAGDLFPPDGLQADTRQLLSKDAFGCQGFDDVWLAAYRRQGATLTAFAARRPGPQEAASQAASYVDFLLRFGGEPLQSPDLPEAMRIVELMGFYELVFTTGVYVAGIHEAPTPQAALDLAAELRRYLQELPDER